MTLENQGYNKITLILALLVVIAFVGWASISNIEQIARAPAQVIASARTQVIQTANDGVIDTMHVNEGQHVTKGQILFSLDRSQAEAAWLDSLAKVSALKAALVRLHAEVFGRKLAFPPELKSYQTFIANQTELFQRRQGALKAEINALKESLGLVQEELDLNLPLLASGDIGKTEIIRLQRQAAELSGQITNRRNKYFQDAQTEMTRAEEDLATQEQVLAERTAILERTEIAAPAEGIVKNIQITTPGAKVRPGDVVMELLPTDSTLVVEAKLQPSDIAYIRKNMPATVKLDAYDYSIYGILNGWVDYISPDALTEKTTSGEQVYYRVRVRIDEEALASRNDKHPDKPIQVQPGMTASIDIITGKQTIMSYLTKPVTKTLSESLHER